MSGARQGGIVFAPEGGGQAPRPESYQPGEQAETHQLAGGSHPNLTTNQGIVIADDQNSLRAGARGPVLLEDFVLREKIFHFDHERIPERVVHARGYGAHGYFEVTNPLGEYSRADLFQRKGEKTPVFARFSTVAGNQGSPDLARDVRGFAVKFYTKQGNWDLVGNNIPVFFIQDAIKFPDLIHAAKQEPDRGFPQAATAHDTFWDYISLTPEAMHMVMWVMSDRGIPRSLRMMEGFGIHTFRLIDAAGASTFVKFHWRPKLGSQSVVWDEALKINGADPDFHRRDMWHAIESGDFPEWELSVQLFDQKFADTFDFDVLDSTKLIPEELVPLRPVGRLVLDRNVDNFFAETEQVAFCTSNVVPGIDFSDDPLLQGRNFSYLDTQLKRLGGPNFHQIPVNQARCPMANFQRDGHMQMGVPKGRVNYEPNSLSKAGPRENPKAGYASFPEPVAGTKQRHRSETFADHFSQARQFFISQTVPEQNHIISAITFELSKVQTPAVREAVLAQLANIGENIAARVAAGLGMADPITPAASARPTRGDLPPSPALSILAKFTPTLQGRKIGVLIADGTDQAAVKALSKAVNTAGGQVAIIAPKLGGASGLTADFQLAGGSSVLFDAVAIMVSAEGAEMLAKQAGAVAFVHDAFQHLKVIGHSATALPLLQKAGVVQDAGVVDVAAFVAAAEKGRIWDREPKVRFLH
jgi:catalase